jgi:hypothetical protein
LTEQADLLLTIAEIAIALAGFAGVVAAFSTFRLAPEATVFRVRLMVAEALMVLVAALLPIVIVKFGVSESTALRISAFLMGLGVTGVAVWAWIGLRPLYQAGLLKTQVITTVWYTIGVALAIGLFSVAAGYMVVIAPAIYLSGLFFGIVLCCFYFIMLILAADLGKHK